MIISRRNRLFIWGFIGIAYAGAALTVSASKRCTMNARYMTVDSSRMVGMAHGTQEIHVRGPGMVVGCDEHFEAVAWVPNDTLFIPGRQVRAEQIIRVGL